MKRTSIFSACVAALCALCAVGAASASAAGPQYLACVKAAKSGKTYTGKYSNKTCSEVNATHEGKYELGAPKLPAKLKGTAGEVNIYLYDPITKTVEGHFECASGKNSGSVTGSSEGTLAFEYKSCEATGALAGPCNSPGQKSGVVVSEALVTKLVWLNEAETEPGIELTAATVGGPITKVVCANGAETAELVGTMVARIAPTTETSKEQKITFTASPTTGEPEFDGKWEGGMFTQERLLSNLKGVKEYEGVPTSQNSTFTEKGPEVLVGA